MLNKWNMGHGPERPEVYATSGWGFVIGAGISLVGSWWSSKKSGEASDDSLQWNQQLWTAGNLYMTQQAPINEANWNLGMDTLSAPLTQMEGTYAGVTHAQASMASASLATAHMAEASLAEAAHAKAYEMEAFKAEAYRVEMDGFLSAFKDASDSADLSLDTFNRRYGQIMDNLETAVLDVERERFATQGREQLMVDADVMKKNLTNSIAQVGLTRSGVSMEMQARMDMEVSRAARDIDVNSYAQAGQLQAQTVGALGGLTALRESIASRGEGLDVMQGQGMLAAAQQNAAQQTSVSQQWAANQQQASAQNAITNTNVSLANAAADTGVSIHNSGVLTNVSLANAAAKTNVSMHNSGVLTQVSMANAAAKTNVSMFNSGADNTASMFNAGVTNNVNQFNIGNEINQQGAIASAYLGRAQAGFNAANSFYSGIGQQGAAGVSSALNTQATNYASSAAGWGQAAGYLTGQYLGDQKTTNTYYDYNNDPNKYLG